MEQLETEKTQNLYPEKETMESFIEIGKKMGYFERNSTIKGGKELIYYKKVNALYAIAIILEYLNKNKSDGIDMGGKNITTTRDILNMLENETKEDFEKKISKILLKIREDDDKSEYAKERIRLYREYIDNQKNFTTTDIPIIGEKYLPNRYGKATSANLIGDRFEAELKKQESIKKEADLIQERYNGYTIKRENKGTNDQIKELTEQL